MDKSEKIKEYVLIIKKLLKEYADRKPKRGDIESQLLFDDEQGYYYLMRVGWDHLRRVHACALHIDIKNDKLYIQEDWTEIGIANVLVERGIPKLDIVLAYHGEYKRPYTGFAVK